MLGDIGGLIGGIGGAFGGPGRRRSYDEQTERLNRQQVMMGSMRPGSLVQCNDLSAFMALHPRLPATRHCPYCDRAGPAGHESCAGCGAPPTGGVG